MRVKVTRELKIAMLEAFRTGYLDLWKCPQILKQIHGYSLFEELLKESGMIDETGNENARTEGQEQ